MPGIEFLLAALTPFHILLALGGVIAGTVIGSLPGLTATMAVAVLVPITFSMEPSGALILMGAIYTGAIYGGAYAAILLNTPGTPSAIATTFDGFPMAKRGDGDLAVTLSCLASVVGGVSRVASLNSRGVSSARALRKSSSRTQVSCQEISFGGNVQISKLDRLTV